jgi:hypothetical protein
MRALRTITFVCVATLIIASSSSTCDWDYPIGFPAARMGAYVIRPQFKHAESFTEGHAVVGDHQSEYWYIDRDGKQAFPSRFALASPFFKGLAHVKVLSGLAAAENIHLGTFAYIDSTGRTVFEYKQ